MPRATNLSRDVEEEVDKAAEVADVAVADLEEDNAATSEAVAMVKAVVAAAAAVPLSLRHRSSQSL